MRLSTDFPAEPFTSAPRLLGRSAVLYFSNLPFVAAITLAVFIPGQLLLQALCAALDIAPEGLISYCLLQAADLVLGALVTGAVIYGLVARLRTGAPPDFGRPLRWGYRIWGRLLWNEYKVEITVALWALLIFIPGILAAVRLALVDPVVAVEGDAAREPLRRSTELTAGMRWRVFFVLAPLALLDAGGSFFVLGAVPGLAHSRVLLALSDSVLAVIAQWTTAAALLMYLGAPTRISGETHRTERVAR